MPFPIPARIPTTLTKELLSLVVVGETDDSDSDGDGGIRWEEEGVVVFSKKEIPLSSAHSNSNDSSNKIDY